jgi:hypothetical protein
MRQQDQRKENARLLRHGDWDVHDAPRSFIESWGPWGSRDLDVTGQHTRPTHRESGPNSSATVEATYPERPIRAESKRDNLTAVRILRQLIAEECSREIGKNPNFRPG